MLYIASTALYILITYFIINIKKLNTCHIQIEHTHTNETVVTCLSRSVVMRNIYFVVLQYL